MIKQKKTQLRHSPAGKRLVGAMREVQRMEFARRIRAVREDLDLLQAEFARKFGFALRSLQEWEQGRRRPDVAVLTYVRVIERNPRAVEAAL